MPDVSSLYPQPPQPGQGFLTGDPLRAIGAISELQNIGIRAQQAPALARIPGAQLQSQQINNQQRQLELEESARSTFLNAVVNGLPERFDPKTGQLIPHTSNDVANAITNASRFLPQAMRLGAGGFAQDQLLRGGEANIDRNIGAARSSLLGPGGAAARTTGPISGGGVQTSVGTGPLTAAGGAVPVSQPVGEAPGQEAAGQAAAAFESGGPQSFQYHANLENMKQDSQVLGNLGGPSTALERPLNALAQRLGMVGVTMTPEQLQAADSFDKIVNQISIGQGSIFAGAGATDAARSMQLHANPNTQMTQKSREALIDMLQGNQDAQDKLREIWANARSQGMPRQSFNDVVRQFTQMPLNKKGATFDPRVFQFNRMSPEARQQFISQMTPGQAKKFETNAEEAQARGWIDIGKPNATQQP